MCQFSLGFLSLPVIGGSFTNDKHRKSWEVIAELVENKDNVVSVFDFFFLIWIPGSPNQQHLVEIMNNHLTFDR